MSYATARAMAPDEIPVVDISGLVGGELDLDAARQLYEASTGLGFIYIRGHGIDPSFIHQVRESAFAFFRASEQDKAQVSVSAAHRGWLASGGARMDDDKPADLKESFLWGAQVPTQAGPVHALLGANQWPTFVPEMQELAMQFYSRASCVATDLLRGFALGLNQARQLELTPDFFTRSMKQPLSRASFVYYPQQPEHMGPERFGVGPHTDFGVLTVLCQDQVGGLQICDINGQWIEAPPIADTLVVNVADLLARWTGGIYKSTPHRVVNSSGQERLSLVLAFDPDPETVVDPCDVLGPQFDQGEPATTCGDYLLWRFSRAFSYRQPE